MSRGLIKHSAPPRALLASRHIPRTLYPVMYSAGTLTSTYSTVYNIVSKIDVLLLSLVYIASDDFTPTTPQTIMFESDSVVNEIRCVEYDIIGDDFKELDEILRIDLLGDDPVDVIAGAAQVSITIEDDQDCKCLFLH